MGEIAYRGSGPYCYTNCLVMMLGDEAPETAVVETVTGSPFGMQLLGGKLPFFDAYGWNPEIGVDNALAALGWVADTTSPDGAVEALAASLADGPVMVGPVEMGHLRYQPVMTGPVGADHYLIALAMTDTRITVHDPQGYPYACLPLADFTAAWSAELDYGRPRTMRTGFVRREVVDPADAIASAVPGAISRLSGEPGADLPPGTLGNGDAALALAELVESGCDGGLREHLIHFAVRVGARRLADAAGCLRAGHGAAAEVATEQARLVGSLQHPLVTGDDAAAGAALRALAPTYDQLRRALENPS